MGNGICSCNGPADKKKEANLARALKEEHIIPYQTKGAITKGDDTAITSMTIESASITEEKDETEYNDLESLHTVDNKPALIPHDSINGCKAKFIANENTAVQSTNITETKDTAAAERDSQIDKSERIQFASDIDEEQSITNDNTSKESAMSDGNISTDSIADTTFANLCICSRNQLDMSMLFEDEYYTFDNCNVLTILYSDIKLLHNNMDKFTHLRHLEMFKPQINGQRKVYKELYKIVNKILDGLSLNLISFKFIGSIQHAYVYQKNSNVSPVLNIPSTMEWLTLKNVGCNINISNCDRLIGIQLLNSMSYDQIMWPMFDNNVSNLIPFAVVCDGKNVDDCEWYDKCVHGTLNVKYVCLLKESFIDCGIIYNDNEMIERFEIDVDTCDNDRKCIILNETELNSELYTKIVRYKFGNEYKMKSDKYNDCLWIKRIGNIEYY